MKIVVIGTRGIPYIMGGLEPQSMELYTRLVAMGHDVTIIRRKPYVSSDNAVKEFHGVKLVDLYAPRKKCIETFVHTFLAVIKAGMLKPDVLHVHAVGPSIFIPFARLLGMKVVMTNHGSDYERKKWGRFAKFVLRTGERLGTKYSNEVIVISKVISDTLALKYGRTDTRLICNGVNAPVKSVKTDYLSSVGIVPGKYILAVGRFVREKGFHDLVDAYVKLPHSGCQLVIAGDTDHEDKYSLSLKSKADRAGAILTGFINGEKLNQVMTNAALFVLPSYHEGLPLVLLEAMSYGLDVLASDIEANRLPCLKETDFFATGDVEGLCDGIRSKLGAGNSCRSYDLSNYNWDIIAKQTESVYKEIL